MSKPYFIVAEEQDYAPVWDPEKLKEEKRWEHAAQKRYLEVKNNAMHIRVDMPSNVIWYKPNLDNDVKQNADNDEVQKKMKALELFHSMEKSETRIMQACELLGINLPHNPDYDYAMMLIQKRITSNTRNTYGRLYRDIFIGAMSKIKEEVVDVPKINVRFAHMVDQWAKENVHKNFHKSHGKDWARKAYDYVLRMKNDFHLDDHFSCTLLDDNTILVYPRHYKKPEPEIPSWNEEDLVVSQLL